MSPALSMLIGMQSQAVVATGKTFDTGAVLPRVSSVVRLTSQNGQFIVRFSDAMLIGVPYVINLATAVAGGIQPPDGATITLPSQID